MIPIIYLAGVPFAFFMMKKMYRAMFRNHPGYWDANTKIQSTVIALMSWAGVFVAGVVWLSIKLEIWYSKS